MKRILVLSDFHCGHLAGLTPPAWWLTENSDAESPTKRQKWSEVQRACWSFYESEVKKHAPYDVLFLNGDMIDGSGYRSGGTEQTTTDREEQAEMAVVAARVGISRKTKVVCTFGTASHTGDAEDFENLVAHDLDAKIGSHEWVDVDGVTFDLKHHCGSSSVPHGRHTAVAKERLWNVLWNEAELAPKSDVIIRSHVHYHSYAGGPTWLALTTPALQGHGSKYGSRRCNGLVDFGITVFEVNKGEYSWFTSIAKIQQQVAQVTKL